MSIASADPRGLVVFIARSGDGIRSAQVIRRTDIREVFTGKDENVHVVRVYLAGNPDSVVVRVPLVPLGDNYPLFAGRELRDQTVARIASSLVEEDVDVVWTRNDDIWSRVPDVEGGPKK